MTAWRFYETINHFQPLAEDQTKRMKYAKVKAVEVHKAVKQMQNNPDPGYKPEPPVMTPGPAPTQSPPVFQPPAFNNDFMNMQPNFAPPSFDTGQPSFQPSFQPSPYPDFFGQQGPKPTVNGTAPTGSPPAPTADQKKKRMDPERIAAQNQAMAQLQNAISELSFNRVGYAKEAIRNAARILEKYD